MFGFTGTPIFEENATYKQIDGTIGSYTTTKDIFEKELHAYTITHAIDDNGTGKTRLSAEFKILGQTLNEETGEKTADTLYYNAFTEDLFYWDNDLENDTDRFLKLNSDSRFFPG